MKAKRVEFYTFAINEYRFRRIYFRRFYSRVKAEKWSYHPYKGNAQSDLSPEILEGRAAFIAWAVEADYIIDWENSLLIYAPKEEK